MTTYDIVRPRIRQGDIFAFGGQDWISNGIKLFTRSAISHVAPVARIEADGRIVLIESTTLDGVKGVQRNYASERIAHYNGDVWWLPLADGVRAETDWSRYYSFLEAQLGKPYDYRQCLQMAWAPLAHVPGLGFLRNHEGLAKFYCSELVAAALEQAGGLPFGVNFSDVSPQDLCEMAIYADYVQIKGTAKLRKFNSRPMLADVAA
jgi:hypothetical protein